MACESRILTRMARDNGTPRRRASTATPLLQHAVEEAARLLEADGAMVYLADTDGRLSFAVDAGIRKAEARSLIRDMRLPVGTGMFGTAVASGEVVVTGDYRKDKRFRHSETADRIVMIADMRSFAVAPLIAEGEVLGGLGVYTSRIDDFGDGEVALLRALADHAAASIWNARLIERLNRSQEELAHRVEAQRALAEIAAQITSIRDAESVLQRTVDEAARLLGADGGRIDLMEAGSGALLWAFGHSAADGPIPGLDVDDDVIRPDEGVSGMAVIERRVVYTGDYLNDRAFSHAPAPDQYIRDRGIVSVMAAPLEGEEEPMGTLTVHSTRPHAFDDDGAELLGALAAQAAIAVTNARLYDELRGRIEAQRSLAEIAAEIAGLHDPSAVIQRAVDEAARLLRADRAQINLLREDGALLERPIAAAPDAPADEDVVVPLGSGIAGMAAVERRVLRTGDYMEDTTFPHDEGDARIRDQGIRSMMSAPLIGPDRLIGTITVQSSRAQAFNDDGAELLGALATQAAIAITNARLYDQLKESERRYRHLVDYSPDIVWSVDADGRFTFLSDSLEARTGWKPSQLLGKPFSMMTGPTSRQDADAAWQLIRSQPDAEHRVRLDLPLANGEVSQAEVAMIGMVVDGRFAGAHGSVRDVTERERLERDLRRQAADLAAGEERAHLARELHDSVTQALFSMGLTVRSLELQLQTDPEAARQKLTELRELQRDALAEMRTLLFELRPSSLENDGLVQAIKNHAAAVQGRTGLALTVDAEPIDRLALEVEEALYRITQEALHNVVKHAGACTARIGLRQDGDHVRLVISDDGAGFDPGQVGRGHLGLIGMQQRADRVASELTLTSRPGKGTVIEVLVRRPGPNAHDSVPAGVSAK